MSAFVLTPQAKADLDEIWDYTETTGARSRQRSMSD